MGLQLKKIGQIPASLGGLWRPKKKNLRLSDSCDSTSADGILYLITTVCCINWNGCWRLTLFITSESSYEIANNISSSLRYINFKIIVLLIV